MSWQKIKPIDHNNLVVYIERKVKQVMAKRLVWSCSCGCEVPKKGAVLSGDSSYRYGFHVHCPICGRVVAQFVDPKVNW